MIQESLFQLQPSDKEHEKNNNPDQLIKTLNI